MNIMSARKHAEDFDALLTGASAPSESSELRDLVEVATFLRESAPVAPRPDFAASLRAQLMAEAPEVLRGEAKSLALPVRRRGTRERRLVAVAAATVFIGGTAGMAAAAQSAVPGDALYGMKRTIERAQTTLSTSDAGKGSDLIAQADDRLREVETLLEDPSKASLVPGTLDDFTAQASEAAVLLTQAYEQDDDAEAVSMLRAFAARSLTQLQEFAKTADPAAQESLAEAARALVTIDRSAVDACTICTDLPSLEMITFTPVATTNEAKDALRRAAEELDEVDNSRVPDATKEEPEAPTTEETTAPKPEKPAKGEKDKGGTLGETVDETTETVEETTEGLLPAVGGLLGGLLGGGSGK